MVTHDEKIKPLTGMNLHVKRQIEEYKDDLNEKWDKNVETILEKLQLSESRMQGVEIKTGQHHLKVIEFGTSLFNFSQQFDQAKEQIKMLMECPKVIERQIPLMIHFQISESLRKVFHDIVPAKIQKFENDKLQELLHYSRKCAKLEGNIKSFASRIN